MSATAPRIRVPQRPQATPSSITRKSSNETLETIHFLQNGVLCAAFIITSEVIEQEDAAARREESRRSRESARKAHYRGILPSPEEQNDLVSKLRAAEALLAADEQNDAVRRKVESCKILLFERFSAYIYNAVNYFANQPKLAHIREEAREELRSRAVEIFQEKVQDYDLQPGGPELSRYLSCSLKYELMGLSRKLATPNSNAGAVKVSDKVLRDVVAYRAAARAGRLDELLASRRWSEKKLASVQSHLTLLNPVERLDAPAYRTESESDDELHEHVSPDVQPEQHAVSLMNDVRRILHEGMRTLLKPLERVVLAATFGLPIGREDVAGLEHETTGAKISWQGPLSLQQLPELLGLGIEKIRSLKMQALAALRDYLRDRDIDAGAMALAVNA